MIEMILKGQTLVVHALNFVVQLPQLLFVITRVSNIESDDKGANILPWKKDKSHYTVLKENTGTLTT